MNFIRQAIAQPVTVAVGVILIILAGAIALSRIPIQLTPNVEDTIISVTTTWEGASPQEIEQEIVDPQEEKLQGIANLSAITSQSQQGKAIVRLEFQVGTGKDEALREVIAKLDEVVEYPDNADRPVVEASDPENRDYIAWIVLSTTATGLDIRTMQDFAEDRIKPILERVRGMSEVGVLGGRERETQIRFDPVMLAQRGITPTQLVEALRRTNVDVSAGQMQDAKANVRVRTISQFTTVDEVERTVIADTDAGPVLVRDVAEVVETHKEPITFVRSRGEPVIAINAQREVGSNVMQVMAGLKDALTKMNAPGGLLDTQARLMGLDGTIRITQVYDQTIYIDQALALVRNNIWIGGALAVLVLLMFLRSARSVGIIALAIPISVIGAVVAMVAMGRTINVISLAGMAFAVGMVVDNAIVVLENIFRHVEMGKPPRAAALDAAREVWGAVLASTLTTIVVFVPILLIEEEAGQLFRDIALAICAAVGLSLIVSVTVIPSAAARFLKAKSGKWKVESGKPPTRITWRNPLRKAVHIFDGFPNTLSRGVFALCGSVLARVGVVTGLTIASILGTWMLMPPADYLPQGNRNLVFGLLIPPPGYNLDKQNELADRIEQEIKPFWEAAALKGTDQFDDAVASLPAMPTFDWMTGSPGDPVTPPPIDNYFLVSFDQMMFHGAVGVDDRRVIDLMPLFAHATRQEVVPDVLAFAFQVPLFNTGGRSGSAVKINFSGHDLDQVTLAAGSAYAQLAAQFGPFTIQPDPSNFDTPGPELQIIPNRVRLGDVGLTPSDLGLAVQANADGAIIGEYKVGSETIDLKLIAREAVDQKMIGNLGDVPIATPTGRVVPLSTVADLHPVRSPPQINRTGRQRSVTLQFTPPRGIALEDALGRIDTMLSDLRRDGVISPIVETTYTGSASKLRDVQRALLGDGTFLGTINSSLVLALLVVYLLMCVLFQSFTYPFVIMFSVPLATLGGFAALFVVFLWSLSDRYMPVQSLDVLTMLGFVILIGVVVNNAILIVHQSLNFMKGVSAVEGVDEPLSARRAIAESVRTRVRPIFMSTLTSLGGMLPLVAMPGSGSELYRGLGAVVLGGLLVSTVFTLLLVPLLMSLVCDLQKAMGRDPVQIARAQIQPIAGAPTRPTAHDGQDRATGPRRETLLESIVE